MFSLQIYSILITAPVAWADCPQLDQPQAGITELEAKLLSFYEILDLVFRATKFLYDILSSLHRRRKKFK